MNYYSYPDINFNLLFSKMYQFGYDVLHYNPSWSLVFLLIVIISIKEIKLGVKKIIEKIPDTQSIEHKGTKINFANKNQNDISVIQDSIFPQKSFADRKLSEFTSVVLEEEMTRINSIVEKEHKNKKDVELIKFLKEEYAVLNLKYYCEVLYSFIYGSQIKLLKILSQNRDGGVESGIIQLYFNNVKQQYPEVYEKWDFMKYLNFLSESRLILENNNSFFITNLGMTFLEWILLFSKSEDKVF